MEIQLDLNDPLVREMAERNHVPDEIWTRAGYVTVLCASCRFEWPCSTRQRLRAAPSMPATRLTRPSEADLEKLAQQALEEMD